MSATIRRRRRGPLARTLRALAFIGITAITSLIGTELVFGLYYTVGHREFFWLRAVVPPPAAAAAAAADPAQEFPNLLSPYLVAVRHPGFRLAPSWLPNYLHEFEGLDTPPDYIYWRANNYGFTQDRDYPVTDLSPNDFVVGIFGSSTAIPLALDGREDIAAALAQNPALAGRHIVVFNFATGGVKAPQQSLILDYFITLGQRFDLIINMDGVGSGYFSWDNMVRYHVDPMMPTARLLIGLQNLMVSKELVDRAAATRARIAALGRAAAGTRSALRYYWLVLSRDRLSAENVQLEERNSEIVPGRFYIELLNETPSTDFQAALGGIVDVWVRNSLTMAALAKSIGAAYVHMLEPNQYFGAKPFSDVERKRFAQPPVAPLSEIIPPTYRALLAASPRLTSAGVDFIDATAAFDRHPETFYIDWCCHLNAAGIHALMTETLSPALRALKPESAATAAP